jgi:hypothetical protein
MFTASTPRPRTKFAIPLSTLTPSTEEIRMTETDYRTNQSDGQIGALSPVRVALRVLPVCFTMHLRPQGSLWEGEAANVFHVHRPGLSRVMDRRCLSASCLSAATPTPRPLDAVRVFAVENTGRNSSSARGHPGITSTPRRWQRSRTRCKSIPAPLSSSSRSRPATLDSTRVEVPQDVSNITTCQRFFPAHNCPRRPGVPRRDLKVGPKA